MGLQRAGLLRRVRLRYRDDPRCDPASIPSNITISAQRGDNILEVHIDDHNSSPVMSLTMTRATPWTAYPAGVIGFLVGALGPGACSAGPADARNGVIPWRKAMAKFLFGFAMFLWWAPISLAAPRMLAHHLDEPHYRWHRLGMARPARPLRLPFLLGCVLLTLVLGLAALPRRRQPADRLLANG